jgi:glycerol-3-phosphate acyltransferase PlsY
MNPQNLFVLVCAYLIGSIPSSFIITYIISGKDIRHLGNGNAGAKNTFESVGLLAGLAVFFFDIGKGVLAIMMARSFTQVENVIMLAGACAVLGHDFPFLLRFKGGQGMATTVGVFGTLFPIETALGFMLFLILLAITHQWDKSCLIGFISLIIIMVISGQTVKRIIYLIIILPLIGLNKTIKVWQTHRFIQHETR